MPRIIDQWLAMAIVSMLQRWKTMTRNLGRLMPITRAEQVLSVFLFHVLGNLPRRMQERMMSKKHVYFMRDNIYTY